MAEVLTAGQMRAIEQAAIASGSVTGLELMERAGAGVVAAIFEAWPQWQTRGTTASRSPENSGQEDALKAVVLCGPGNNGGDGFVIARLLKQSGWEVTVSVLGDPDRLPPDARTNFDRWVELGTYTPLTKNSLGTVETGPDLVVDAVFGTGLARKIEGDLAALFSHLTELRAETGVKCVAVDIPSGVCSDSGQILGIAPHVDLTVSFHAEKLGHTLDQVQDHSSRVVVCDIGLPHATPAEARTRYAWKTEPPDADSLRKTPQAQKYSYGHVLVLSGGCGRTGAARLAARSALRVGAGLVTLGVPCDALTEVACQITAVMMTQISDVAALRSVLEDRRLNTLCLGPGLGLDERARSLVETVLEHRRPAVLDADALTMFRDDPKVLFARLHAGCVITPHGGEFARLFPDLAERLMATADKGPAYSKVDATRSAAQRAGCTVLFKGADTVIATPDGQCAVHVAQFDRSAPWLATAGSGDVLSGLVSGLLARGMSPMQAAETAAWLHVQSALDFGPGLIAEDLPEILPHTLRNLIG
ncbi:NAD(P)H-hydrate dehydratase [Rhodobacteraceae bacterium M382]|nr:NAD(P)H-hydrate dehydratase [Rhodobacteraceae bacterium M382]